MQEPKDKFQRTPEEQKAIEEFHKNIGQALVGNLNANVEQEQQEQAAQPPKQK
jgi:hypothetical protein